MKNFRSRHFLTVVCWLFSMQNRLSCFFNAATLWGHCQFIVSEILRVDNRTKHLDHTQNTNAHVYSLNKFSIFCYFSQSILCPYFCFVFNVNSIRCHFVVVKRLQFNCFLYTLLFFGDGFAFLYFCCFFCLKEGWWWSLCFFPYLPIQSCSRNDYYNDVHSDICAQCEYLNKR